jgi:hypothetical protein
MTEIMRDDRCCNEPVHTLYPNQQIPFRLKRFLMTKLMDQLRKIDRSARRQRSSRGQWRVLTDHGIDHCAAILCDLARILLHSLTTGKTPLFGRRKQNQEINPAPLYLTVLIVRFFCSALYLNRER